MTEFRPGSHSVGTEFDLASRRIPDVLLSYGLFVGQKTFCESDVGFDRYSTVAFAPDWAPAIPDARSLNGLYQVIHIRTEKQGRP